MVVVAKPEMEWNPGFANRLDQLGEELVFRGRAAFMGEIPVDDRPSGPRIEIRHLGHDLLKMRRHVEAAIRLFGFLADMRVRQERNAVGIHLRGAAQGWNNNQGARAGEKSAAGDRRQSNGHDSTKNKGTRITRTSTRIIADQKQDCNPLFRSALSASSAYRCF